MTLPTESESVLMRCVLGPCAGPGRRVAAGDATNDWWREPHVMCTGSHHMSADEVVECSCPCHTTHPILRCPRTYDRGSYCTCHDDAGHREQEVMDAAVDAVAPEPHAGPRPTDGGGVVPRTRGAQQWEMT